METRRTDVSPRSRVSGAPAPTTPAALSGTPSTSTTTSFGYVDFDAASALSAPITLSAEHATTQATVAASTGYVDFDCLDTTWRPRQASTKGAK